MPNSSNYFNLELALFFSFLSLGAGQVPPMKKMGKKQSQCQIRRPYGVLDPRPQANKLKQAIYP